MSEELKQYTAPAVQDWGKVVDLTQAGGVSAFGGGSKCNQGIGNGGEGCDPGNSNNRTPTNDEGGQTPGNPGKKQGVF